MSRTLIRPRRYRTRSAAEGRKTCTDRPVPIGAVANRRAGHLPVPESCTAAPDSLGWRSAEWCSRPKGAGPSAGLAEAPRHYARELPAQPAPRRRGPGRRSRRHPAQVALACLAARAGREPASHDPGRERSLDRRATEEVRAVIASPGLGACQRRARTSGLSPLRAYLGASPSRRLTGVGPAAEYATARRTAAAWPGVARTYLPLGAGTVEDDDAVRGVKAEAVGDHKVRRPSFGERLM